MSSAMQFQEITKREGVTAPFDYQPRTHVIFGCGAFSQLGAIVAKYKVQRVLLVTDAGLREAGHSETAIRSLQGQGLDVAVFDRVSPNPTTRDVRECVEFARKSRIQLIVGLGGGSSMDCAKGANFLLTNGGTMQDYKGVGRATKEMLPMIAVPTTSGTGSEAQSFAVIADEETHVKMACGDTKAACKVAILDPELTVTMPRTVAAATGIDAMTHAIESFVTRKRNTVSQMFARQAWTLLSEAFPIILDDPENLEARGGMQLGAFFAGSAIENSMLGAAHAAANPLTARYGTVHGKVVGLLLPHVIRWNGCEVGELYRELNAAAGWGSVSDTTDTAMESLAAGFTELLKKADMPLSIEESIGNGDVSQIVESLAAEAAQQWTGTFNPRTMDVRAFTEIYRNAM